MKIEGLAAAITEARERAANYDGEDCEAADAWRALARRSPRATPPVWAFADAWEDARCSEDPDLIEAVEKIAADAITRLQGTRGPVAATRADEILEVFGV